MQCLYFVFTHGQGGCQQVFSFFSTNSYIRDAGGWKVRILGGRGSNAEAQAQRGPSSTVWETGKKIWGKKILIPDKSKSQSPNPKSLFALCDDGWEFERLPGLVDWFGARTFQSAAMFDGSARSEQTETGTSSGVAADWKVRLESPRSEPIQSQCNLFTSCEEFAPTFFMSLLPLCVSVAFTLVPLLISAASELKSSYPQFSCQFPIRLRPRRPLAWRSCVCRVGSGRFFCWPAINK